VTANQLRRRAKACEGVHACRRARACVAAVPAEKACAHTGEHVLAWLQCQLSRCACHVHLQLPTNLHDCKRLHQRVVPIKIFAVAASRPARADTSGAERHSAHAVQQVCHLTLLVEEELGSVRSTSSDRTLCHTESVHGRSQQSTLRLSSPRYVTAAHATSQQSTLHHPRHIGLADDFRHKRRNAAYKGKLVSDWNGLLLNRMRKANQYRLEGLTRIRLERYVMLW
jgi:hypothetical protein